jgi:hypothetical protein
VQDRIAELNQKSEELSQARTSKTDRFLDYEKKEPFSAPKNPDYPDFAGSLYNKRNQYSTVYDAGFFPSKNVSGKPKPGTIGGGPLSNAGNNAMNPNLTTYQAQEMLRRTPFGEFSSASTKGKVTSSSVYGGFFK